MDGWCAAQSTRVYTRRAECRDTPAVREACLVHTPRPFTRVASRRIHDPSTAYAGSISGTGDVVFLMGPSYTASKEKWIEGTVIVRFDNPD